MSQEGNSQGPKFLGRSPTEWLLSLPIFALLLLTLVIGTGEYFHGQLLRMGESMFGDQASGVQYFMMRADPEKPECDPNPNIDEAVQKEMNSGGGGDAIDALFADEAKDPEAIKASIVKAAELCQEKHKMYDAVVEHITPTVKAYRTLETSFFWLFHFGTENRPLLLLLMVLLASINTTLGEHHIALRPPKTRVDFRIYSLTMSAANLLLMFSSVMYLKMQKDSGIPIEKPFLYYIWIGMFSILSLISLKQVVRMPERATPGGSVGMALLSIPLYAWMSLIGGTYFLTQKHYPAQAIYLNQMVELSGIFLNLALFIWAGMLLKQTQVVDRFLDILRPWKFSPEVLTWFILLGAALPTAYTGASGIFVIAAGALIYKEVRHAGGSRQFALAASAMSGSLGVVLRPCLLIVLIAALNKQVTTAQLYSWGFWVFLLSSTLFLIAALASRTTTTQLEKPGVAIPGMARALLPVVPYVIITLAVVLFYKYALNTKLDEFTAPVIMPLIMVVLVIFDRLRKDSKPVQLSEVEGQSHELLKPGFGSVEKSIRFATNETIGHIGALILLMALSLSMGGVVERSGIMENFPSTFSNVWMAMTFLMVAKVILGMIMDPFGAVILVSATLAPIAYNNGIDPVHFWMMVLVAFELGYLLPPVALNQLLLRQVVGEKEIDLASSEVKHLRFYRRYERWILPIIVLTATLLIVAYGPLATFGK
ncbi:MAG TPA: TRAP transporter large permease subunit [Moraxellaceae bacterium]|nr:TRAP transporter large permease subunit [Moraxellaceae bacterium]